MDAGVYIGFALNMGNAEATGTGVDSEPATIRVIGILPLPPSFPRQNKLWIHFTSETCVRIDYPTQTHPTLTGIFSRSSSDQCASEGGISNTREEYHDKVWVYRGPAPHC